MLQSTARGKVLALVQLQELLLHFRLLAVVLLIAKVLCVDMP